MSDAWDDFLRGFDPSEPELEEPDATDILVQMDALREERRERGDSRWQPPASWGRDPENLERLVRERWARYGEQWARRKLQE
jgi:hypothetical protein